MNMLFPYVTLQMSDLGLSLEDISNINGLLPFVTFLAQPVIGMSLLTLSWAGNRHSLKDGAILVTDNTETFRRKL